MLDLMDDPTFGYDFAMFLFSSFQEVEPSVAKEELKEKVKDNPLFYADIFDCPSTFKQAWYHQDKFQREKWQKAIKKGLDKMEALKVWKKIDKNEMEKDWKPIKCKWIFVIKQNVVFRARLVASGYSQIPGIDFDESYALLLVLCVPLSRG